jgi:hypothetical protein
VRPGPVIQRLLVIGPADEYPDQQLSRLHGRVAASQVVAVLAYNDPAHRARGEARLDLAVDEPLQLQ